MSDPWCYGKRQDRSIYGTDQVCTPGGKTGDCADSGDCIDFQTVLRFYNHFGERVSILNSRMSPGERSDQFERAKRGLLDVMIGPRSALFTPFPNLGVIIIDEEHENYL